MIYEDIVYEINSVGVRVVNSYLVTDDRTKLVFIDYLLETIPELKQHRKRKQLLREWKAHNICYQHGWWKDHTADVDFEFKQKLFPKIAFFFISILLKERA